MVIPKFIHECNPYPVLLIGILSILCCSVQESLLTESQGNGESFDSSVTDHLLTFINHSITCYYDLTNHPVTAKILMLVHSASELIGNS